MDQAPYSHQSVKQTNCQQHKCQSLDQVDLTGNSPNGRICLLCIKKNKMAFDQFISISELLAQREGEMLSSYPPFQNEKIREEIQMYCQQISQKQDIDSFFHKLREDIEAAISEAEQKAKQQLIKNENSQQILLEELSKIGEIDKFKELLILESEKINDFLKDKWKNTQQNERIIQNCINSIKGSTAILNLEKKQIEFNCLIDSFKKLSLFDPPQDNNININNPNKNIINSSKLIKSTFSASPKFNINETKSHFLQLINTTSKSQLGQAFLDFVIDPQKKYIIRLNYQSKQNKYFLFYFGLVQDKLKDQDWSSNQGLSYCNDGGFGISKQTIGPSIFKRKIQREQFEMRISLKEKILKIATLPNYESVIELDDPNKIQPKTEYRVFVLIYFDGDLIEITDIIESDAFENDKF